MTVDEILVEVIYPIELLMITGGKVPLCTWGSRTGRNLESTIEEDTATDRFVFKTIEAAGDFIKETIWNLSSGPQLDRDAIYIGRPYRIVYQAKEAARGTVGEHL